MSLFATALRYWHTLRYLKPVQFYGRVWFRLYRPSVDVAAQAPSLRLRAGVWRVPAARRASMPGPASFTFLNHTHALPPQGGWNNAALEKLWLYNLHYFDDLNASGADQRGAWHQALLQRWLLENPPTAGNGWEPYPTSLRMVNWVKWLLAGNPAPPGLTHSLATQARWLAQRLERHLLGNHLFANAKALVFAGLFFEGPQAAAWLATGLKIIARELPEQVLADGGNFERSPMYHAIFLEDVLDLVNAVGQWPGQVPEPQVAQWREVVGRMLDWLAGMTHPDGEIAFFNDAALGIAPEPAALFAYAQRLGIAGAIAAPRSVIAGLTRNPCGMDPGSWPGMTNEVVIADSIRNPVQPAAWVPPDRSPGQAPQVRHDRGASLAIPDLLHLPTLLHFPDSGYVRLEAGNAVALLDVAPVGPDYLPGHAHADTLSFELSLFGQRVVVNSGTSRYGLGAERLRQRGTAAHSTVEVDGADSSEVWGGFRVARRARPFGLTTETDNKVLTVTCAHDGYRRLPGKPIHRRRWRLDQQTLQVSDFIEGSFRTAVARYYLHPAVHVTGEGGMGQLQLADGRVVRWSVTGGAARVVAATWHPEFGLSIACQRIEVLFDGPEVRFEFTWA